MKFRAAHDALVGEGGGLVSVYYHPNEFVHREFWDAVNFKAGANPPPAAWRLPALKTDDERRVAFETLEGYVRFMKSFPAVDFITASDAATLYRDRAQGRRFSAAEVREIAASVGDAPGFQRRGDLTLAASEILTLLVDTLLGRPPVLRDTPAGPTEAPPVLLGPVTTPHEQFLRATEDVAAYLAQHRRVPSAVWLGSLAVPPESYLATLARLVVAANSVASSQISVEVRPATLASASHVADDGPRLWSWSMFAPGFRAPGMMALAKRQAWTLKPALLRP